MPDFTQTITETWTGDSGTINSTQSITIGSITDVFKRVVTIEANQDVILANFDANVSDTAIVNLDVENIKYVRVTNLDSAESVNLNLQIDVTESGSGASAANETATILLAAGQSFVMGTSHDSIAAYDADSSVQTTLHDLESILIDPSANAVDVEIFVASA